MATLMYAEAIYDDSVPYVLPLLLFFSLSLPDMLLFTSRTLCLSNSQFLFYNQNLVVGLIGDHFSPHLMLKLIQLETLHFLLFHKDAGVHGSACSPVHPLSN